MSFLASASETRNLKASKIPAFAGMTPSIIMPIYIAIAAITLDGKIAKDSHHMSTTWTSQEDKVFFRNILKECDVCLVGRSTYETSKEPLSKRNTIVLSRSPYAKASGDVPSVSVTFCDPAKTDLKKLIEERDYQKVAVLGGSQIYTYCLQNEMIDELYLTVEPIVFGQGIGLFSADVDLNEKFQLISSQSLNTQGTLLLRYKK
nr:Dihydrofolate reductase [uncultured bacterium]